MRHLLVILILLPCHLLAQSQYAAIGSVSVDTTSERKVAINWEVDPASASQVYAIYHWASSKWVQVVDSLPSAMRAYQDVVAHPFAQPERYAMSTSIPGLSDSPLSDFHQTVFLSSGDIDLCSRSLRLQWSPYIGTAVNSYSVYGREKGKKYEKLGDVTDSVFCTNALTQGATYYFYVEANLQNGRQSISNIISYNVFNPAPADESLVVIDTLLNNQETVELHCGIDSNADLSGYAIQVSDGSYFSTDTIFADYSAVSHLQYRTNLHSAFRLSAMDYCGNAAYSSSEVNPLIVNAETSDEQIIVKWNRSLGQGETFAVYCSVDGGPRKAVRTDLADCQCEMAYLDIADELAQNFCFSVESTLGRQLSVSNMFCVERQPDIVIPNAFTPNGDDVNDTFGPVIRNAQVSSFEFMIYDRYGGRMFSSNDQFSRWDGTSRGSYVAEGGYLYYLKIKLHNGRQIERKGSVNVIYP